MKHIYKFLILFTALSVFFNACKKFDDLDSYGKGTAVVLNTDKAVVAPPATDSDNVVLTLSWTNPNYATSISNYKFVIEIAEQGTDFANPSMTTVVGVLQKQFTGRELNNMLSGFGFLYDEPHDMDVRVISSYLNNNEQYISNIVPINMTAYQEPSTTIDATTMNVIGEAALGWDTDVPLNLIGTRKFSGVVNMQWGKEWKLRRDAGDWTYNWGLADGTTFELGAPLAMKKGGANFAIPTGTGSADFQILVDIDANTVTVTEVKSTMNIIGDAGIDWNTDIPMNNLGGGKFSLVTDLQDKQLKFRQTPGDWGFNWGLADGETFEVGKSFAIKRDGGNIQIPAVGKYKVEIDLSTNTAKISASNFPENLYLVGGGTPAGWDPAQSLPFMKQEDGKFEIYSPITDNGEFKFLEVKDWAGDWGNSKVTSGQLEQNDEQNCGPYAAGFYKINCDFISGTWTALKTDWGLIGSATPGGWDSDTNLSLEGNYTWKVTLDLVAGEVKFRANDDWGINFGDNDANGSLEYGGANIAIGAAGNYTITLDLDPAGYSYSVQKN